MADGKLKLDDNLFIEFVKYDDSFKTYDFKLSGTMPVIQSRIPVERVVDILSGDEAYNVYFSTHQDTFVYGSHFEFRYQDNGRVVTYGVTTKRLMLRIWRVLVEHQPEILALIPPVVSDDDKTEVDNNG